MKIRVLAFLFILPLLAAAQDKLTLSANIKGLVEDSKVYLLDARQLNDTLASTVAKKEKFELTTVLKEPMMVNLVVNGAHTILFLDNNKVKTSGDVKELGKLKTTGSPTHKDFMAMQAIFNPYFERLTRINQNAQATNGGNRDSLANAFYTTRDSIIRATKTFVQAHPSTAPSAFLILVTMEMENDILLTEEKFGYLKPSAISNLYGKQLKQLIDDQKATAIGGVAADFTQPDTSGVPVSLSSFRGKYVLVDFWASWCGPCRQENPYVVQTYNKFKNKNFTILGVSLDREGQKQKWIDAIHKDNLTWTHVSDLQFWSNAVAVQYKVQSIPQNFLIDPSGKIVAKNLRGQDLEQKLCEILGCN
jgi:peroxiredoxin